jgi:uncharacterized repeat protein (TIGR01451 family)
MKKRVFMIVSICLLSLALASIALATAGMAAGKAKSTGMNIAGSQPEHAAIQPEVDYDYRIPTLAGQQPDQDLPAHNQPQPQSISPQGYQQMREQAMANSRSGESQTRSESQGYPGRQGFTPSAFFEGFPPESVPAGITADLAYERVYGHIDPGTLVTITRTGDGAYGSAQADGTGFFWTPLFDNGIQNGLNAGDELQIWQDGVVTVVTIPTEPQGSLDLVNDQVIGSIPGDTGGTAVTVTLGLWNWPADVFPTYTATTQPDGSFLINLTVDAGAENFAVVTYGAPFHVRTYLFPDPRAFLVEQYNVVAGYAPVNTPVTVTVYITYPSDPRWQGTGWAEWPLGFYFMNDVDVQAEDFIEVEYADGTRVNTVVRPLGFLSYDTNLDQAYGWATAGTTLRLNITEWQGDHYQYIETHAVAGPDNHFTATFTTVDFSPSNLVDIIIADNNGSQTHMISGPPYLDVQLDPRSEWDCVSGRVDEPGQPITLSVQTASGTYTRTNPIGPSDPGNFIGGYGFCYLVWGPGWGPINFSPGDIVTLQSPTWVGQVIIPEITWQADTANDWISGNAPSGELEVNFSQWQSHLYPTNDGMGIRSTSDGSYSVAFPNFDVRDGGGQVVVRSFDPATDFSAFIYEPMRTLQVEPPHGVWGSSPIPDEPMTAELYDEALNLLATTNNDGDGDPYNFWLWFDGFPLQPGYWVTVTGQSGWQAGIQVPEITIQADEAADLIWGEAPASLLYLDGSGFESGFSQFVPAAMPVDGYELNTTWLGHDLQRGDEINVYSSSLQGSRSRHWYRLGELFRVEFWLNQNQESWMWGEAQPGSTVTITTPLTQVTAYANPQCGGCWNTGVGELYPGDIVEVAAGAGQYPLTLTIPDPLTAYADAQLDQVWGQIGGWISRTVQVHGGWPDGYREVTSDPDGNYLATYPDVPPGGNGYIRFEEQIETTWVVYHRPFQDLTPVFQANYAHEWVEGSYEPGHTIWITLTDPGGAVKATATGITGLIPWWGNQSGFSTNYNLPWAPPNPDLQPDDWVTVLADNGLSSSTRLGVITGALDIENDTVSGNMYAPWFTQTLWGDCGIWEQNGPGTDFYVDPNGGSYSCNFADLGWDLQPGQNVGVGYLGLDNNRVYNVFKEPAPHLWINTWGEGTPGEGGNYILSVQYNNDGDALAPGVTISMTLLEGMTYLADSSGLPVSGSGAPGNPLIWQVGDLPVNWYFSPGYFQVYVQVTSPAGNWVRERVQIETSLSYYQGDYDRKQSYWEGEVQPLAVDLNLNKWAWTGDPAHGYDFVYQLNPCNNQNTSSAQVILTDSLPLSTTLVDWWSDHPGWQLISASDHELVVSRLAFPSYNCSSVYIQVYLDPAAWPGMPLYNHAEIYTPDDLNPSDNIVEQGISVGNPHANLGVWRNWVFGQLVPGGDYYSEFLVQNTGNIPVDNVVVTHTLPPGVIFDFAYTWSWQGWQPFTPSLVTDEYIVWELGTMMAGFRQDIGLRTHIDSQTPVGAELPFTISVSALPGEDRYDDNQVSWVETVNDYGPNLRLDKHSNWRWNWEGQLQYELRIHNLGTQRLENVWITDTYPLSTTLNNWWQNHGPWITATHDADNRQLIFWVESLNPGDTASVGFDFNLNPDVLFVQGLAFTNMLEAPWPGDVNLSDNFDTVTAYTGPDVFTHKWLSEGEPRAGEIITFTVEFGNANRWPWDSDWSYGSHLTDTLPEGMTFITATAPWDPEQSWTPELITGQQVVWGWGTMWAENTWSFQIVAQIDEGLPGETVLTNVIEAYGDDPEDIEPDWTNNLSEAPVTLLGPSFQVNKTYQGNGVAGTTITYTLSAENIGNELGTGLQVIDWTPDWFTYLGGGDSYNAGVVTWTVPSLEVGNLANVSFWGMLACDAGGTVDNQFYRVESSDQGIASPYGPSVSFDIQAPQIVASFEASTSAPHVGQIVSFTSTSTTNGTPLSYAWDFDDGATATGSQVEHAFAAPGSYPVTLTVTDACGFSQQYSLTIEVLLNNFFLPIINK